MKISIITVCFNSEEHIKCAIESVVSQTYDDIEYIVIDGGSIDKTNDIIKAYSDHISYTISEKDSGIYEALNKGVRFATGEIVGVLHADDYFADNSVLQRVAANYKNNPGVDILFADISFVDRVNIKKNIRFYSSGYFSLPYFRFGFMPAHPATYIKRNCFEKFGYYREEMKIAADYELLLRYMYVNKVIYLYCKDTWVKMRAGGVSTKGLKATKLLNREILDSCKLNNVYSNSLLVYSKYFIKIWSFLFKK